MDVALMFSLAASHHMWLCLLPLPAILLTPACKTLLKIMHRRVLPR